MEKSTTEEMLNKYGRESKNIQYSTRLFEKKLEETTEQPTIILRELVKAKSEKDENDEKEKNIWTIILKYKINEVPQEVILGMLGETSDRKNKAIEIINLIKGQLEENVTLKAGYENYSKLSQYIGKENIPFKLTMEGTEILASKSKEAISIPRTYYINTQGKLSTKFTQEDIKKMKEERKNGIKEYIEQQKIIKRWNERRKKILETLSVRKQEQEFLKGEGITEFIQKTDEDKDTQKDIVSEYLIEAFDEDAAQESPKLNLAKGYLQIKEKGISIDIKKKLEDIESRYYEVIKEHRGNVSYDDYKRLETITDYKNFFDLVKVGKDWNARLNFKIKGINFNVLRRLFEAVRYNDKEVLEYLDLKERVIDEIQTDEIELDYSKHESVQDLYKFLLKSNIRENTKKVDQQIVSGVYDHVKREIIENNYDEVELYNHYAEKSQMPTYNIPKEKKDKPFSKIARKICDDIDSQNIKKLEESER